jgi:starch-binding outer membrane protein, SusD/RagB family
MKKITKYILVAVIAMSQVSCNDWLELLPPNGLIREEFWKTKEDVESVLMAAYSTFSSMDRQLFLYGELRADMLEGSSNQPGNERMIMQNNIYPDNDFSNWNTFYKVINYCNEVIVNAPKVQEVDNTFNDYQKQALMAEAYFLRSLAYFYMVRVYGEVPLVLEPTETDDADFYVKKQPESVVLDQIVADLESNRAFAPSGSFKTLEENKGRASKAAYDALLADIALWRFDYEKVISHVQQIEVTTKFVLLPGGRWFELFYPGNSLEGIFEFQFDGNYNQLNGTYGLTNKNSNQYKPSPKAIEMLSFEFASELVRGEESSIKKYGEDDFIVWKYVGQAPDGQTVRAGNEQYSCNYILYRYADVLLMKAEALSQLGRYTEAYNLITKIRDRAGQGSIAIANTPTAYEDAILNERSIELAYEGKRWFDLLRMGTRNNYARKDKLIEIIVSNVPSTQKRILATKLTNPLGWYLPIYEKEIERNRELVQNPYYEF